MFFVTNSMFLLSFRAFSVLLYCGSHDKWNAFGYRVVLANSQCYATIFFTALKQEAGVVLWIMDICCLVELSVIRRMMKMAFTCSCSLLEVWSSWGLHSSIVMGRLQNLRNYPESSCIGRPRGRTQQLENNQEMKIR